MEGDVERLSFMHRDVAAHRELTLWRGQHGELSEYEARDIQTTLDKMRANSPELIHGFRNPVYDRAKAKLAIDVFVCGSHEVIQQHAWRWADQLGGEPIERGWSISH